MLDIIKNGGHGNGRELIKVIIREFVGDFCGGEDVRMFIGGDIIIIDIIIGLELGNINMLLLGSFNKII